MTPRPTDSPWLTKEEAAVRGRVPLDQITLAVRTGTLHSRRVGRRVVIHRDWLDAWLAADEEQAS